MLTIDVRTVPVSFFGFGEGRVQALHDLIGRRVGGVVVAAGEELVDFEAHPGVLSCLVGWEECLMLFGILRRRSTKFGIGGGVKAFSVGWFFGE